MIRKLMVLMTVFTILSTSAYAYAEEVYATKNGKKYHKEICRLIKNKSPQKITKEEALKKGLEPCQLCYKDELSKNLSNDKVNEKITKSK